VSLPISSPWRIASVAVVLGLLGSCAAVLALADSPGGATVARRTGSAAARRAGHSLRSRRPAVAADAVRARQGLQLMSEAAAAGQVVSYRGLQIVAWWGRGGASASVVQVWHQPGSGTMAQVSGNTALPGAVRQSAAGQDQDRDGILAVSRRLLALMRANYQIVYVSRGTADDRPAEVVELWRPDGSVAARFWLDTATRLPLRREIFDTRGAMISEDAYIDLEVGQVGLDGMPTAGALPWTGQLGSAEMAALRAQGWPLPAAVLAGHLTLFAASETSTRSGQVIDLSYSDGLSEVSLFLQRGQLPRELPGWQRLSVHGQTILSSDPDERCLAWSARGFVYTMIADAPPAAVNQIVAVLPHDGQLGTWGRMARGLRRLASWINPFG
jgi:sigma-E factor negative regulatory protein RseB